MIPTKLGNLFACDDQVYILAAVDVGKYNLINIESGCRLGAAADNQDALIKRLKDYGGYELPDRIHIKAEEGV